MNAHSKRVGVLLEQTIRLRAPLFQRPYVWTIENWEPLWDSIRMVADRLVESRDARPHFLGAIVLEQEMAPVGGVGDVRRIIDGQQRLTTLQVLLAVLRDLASGASLDFQAETFTRLTKNHTVNPQEQFKVVPTTDDRGQYEWVMTAGAVSKVIEGLDESTERLLGSCYLFFHDRIMEWLEPHGLEKGLALLGKVIQQYLILVAVELDGKDDDAQEIFETLNYRGEQLLPADLVKNFLLQSAEAQGLSEDQLRDLYERYWREFDRENRYWRKKVRQGRLLAPRMNTFLQHYLTLKRGEEILVGNLFGEFRVLASGRPVEGQLSELKTYAAAYRSIDEPQPDAREYRLLYRVGELDVSTFHPVILETLIRSGDRRLSATAADQVLVDLESYLVRRAVCGLTTKAYNRFVVDLIRKVDPTWDPGSIREFLLDQRTESTVWPTDRDFRRAWMSMPLYRGKRSRVRMVLEAINAQMHDSKSEKMKFAEKLTVEHLMPRKWEKHWPLTDGTSEKQRERLIHTIGNLTLLTRVLNPAVSNGPWVKKRDRILEHSALSLNRGFRDKESWTEADIEARAEGMFAFALALWPRPHDDRGEDALRDVEPDLEEDVALREGRRREEIAALVARFREAHGDEVAGAVERLAFTLVAAGISVRPGRSSLRAGLRLDGHQQRLSLFFIDIDGRVKFGWMRTGQLADLGLSDEFADGYYRAVAERFDVGLKKEIPDGLTVQHIVGDPALFAELVTDFTNEVRNALAGETTTANDDEEDEAD